MARQPEGHDGQERLEASVQDDVFDRVLHRIIDDIDPEQESDELREALKFAVAGSDIKMGDLMDAVEEAQEMARRAHALYCKVSVEVARSMVDLRAEEAAIRDSAREDLENEKQSGDRKKAITNDDVRTQMDTRYTDAVRSIEARTEVRKRTTEHFEQLYKLWRDRARSLDTLAGMRRARGTDYE